jgi:hypothetical protein
MRYCANKTNSSQVGFDLALISGQKGLFKSSSGENPVVFRGPYGCPVKVMEKVES